MECLKTRNIYYLTVYVGQKSEPSVAGCHLDQCLTRLPSGCWPGLQSSQSLTGGRSTAMLIPMAVSRPKILAGCWPETSVF